jgi:prepilin-type N-terminal cleavage/methylation domain-containing protein
MSKRQCIKGKSGTAGRSAVPSEKGFTLLEMMLVCLIIGITVGTAVMAATNIMPEVHADSALDLVVAQLRQVRLDAIDQRRDFVVTFTGTNEVTVVRDELNGTQTSIATYFLSNGVTYTVMPTVPDTPDGFGKSSAVDLGGGNSVTFVSNGTALSSSGALLDGTVFMGIPGNTATARAVTVMGATSQIQGYRYNGSAWH